MYQTSALGEDAKTMEPIEWHTQPRLWLDQLLRHVDSLYSFHPSDRRRWLAVQHQVLTLANAKSASSLWFTLGRNPSESRPQPFRIWGVALPARKIVLTSPEMDFAEAPAAHQPFDRTLREFLIQRFEPRHVIATPNLIATLQLLAGSITTQTAWWRSPLARTEVRQERLSLRRAIESDRKQVARWAEVFSKETKTQARDEALAWLSRGRLLLFENLGKPVGMAAFTGEFEDQTFGRLARISLVFVDPSHRQFGFGAEILNLMSMEAQIDGISGIILFSDSSQPKAHRFYARSGFQPLGEVSEFNVNTTG